MIKLKFNHQSHAAAPVKDLFAGKQMLLLPPTFPALKELRNLLFFPFFFFPFPRREEFVPV